MARFGYPQVDDVHKRQSHLSFSLIADRLATAPLSPFYGVPQIEDARVAHKSETPALPWRYPDWQHAMDGTKLHAVLGQQTAEFLGPNKQAPVVSASWCQASEVFPKPDRQRAGQPGTIDCIV